MGMKCEELYKTSQVRIDSYENHVLTGQISNPYWEADHSFNSTIEFLKEMETLARELEHPQAFFEKRTFRPVWELTSEDVAPSASAVKKGALATFSLRIIFRKNASWQGVLIWAEEKREEKFRSVLELLLLLDSALERVCT